MRRSSHDAARNRRPHRVTAAAAKTVATALALCLCGCSLHKPPQQSAILTQALPNATPLPPAWSSTPDTADVSDGWMKSFHDPGLESVVNEAIANNTDLRQAAARVEAARANVALVGSKLKPQIHVDVNGATTDTSDTTLSTQQESNTEYGELAWEVDVWGRLRSQRAAARESYEGIALDYAFARQSLAATTAKSWYLAIETHQLLAIAEQSVTIYTKLLELVKFRRTAGKVADLDVAEASFQLSEAQAELIKMQTLYSESKRTLELLVGRYPAAELKVGEAFAPLPPPVTPGLPSSLLERRPDIAAAEHQVQAAFRTQQAAKLALLPTFSFTLEGGRLGDRLLSVLGLNPWLLHSAVGMLVPVYDGGALRAQVRIANAQQEQAVAYFGSVALGAFNEVETALTYESSLAQTLPLAQSALADHSEAIRVANLKYKYGNMDLLSLLQLQEGQLKSQAALVQVRNGQLANCIDLHLALGGSFNDSPATPLSSTP